MGGCSTSRQATRCVAGPTGGTDVSVIGDLTISYIQNSFYGIHQPSVETENRKHGGGWRTEWNPDSYSV
jgi:hypothetical protein